jgi:hypothetical protein
MPATILVMRAMTFVDPSMRPVDAASIQVDARTTFVDVGT